MVLERYQQITLTEEGIGHPVTFDHETERKVEWVRWNGAKDVKAAKEQTIIGQLRSPVPAND
jgi:hypothetical protein